MHSILQLQLIKFKLTLMHLCLTGNLIKKIYAKVKNAQIFKKNL
jgi:hypothetical protein